ncbi:MAG: GNAT family N-acetyltransferase [Hyphomonadaceae bacterium]|nr:GNAT family N-acetyltransferase [Hyphomonadaceae bacterium]
MRDRLETERLILRPLDGNKDFEDWYKMTSDPETMRFIGGSALNRGQSWRSMAMMIGHAMIRGYSMFAVIEKETNQFVGRVGPWFPEMWEAPEIGWGLTKSATGRGYAVEAAQACLDFVFDDLGWDNVIHCIDAENIGSIKVAERIGSKYLRTIQSVGDIYDGELLVYGQDRP